MERGYRFIVDGIKPEEQIVALVNIRVGRIAGHSERNAPVVVYVFHRQRCALL